MSFQLLLPTFCLLAAPSEPLSGSLRAWQLICEAKSLRIASSKSPAGRKASSRFKGLAKKVVAANRVVHGGGRLTTQGYALGFVSHASRTGLRLNSTLY